MVHSNRFSLPIHHPKRLQIQLHKNNPECFLESLKSTSTVLKVRDFTNLAQYW